MANPPTQERDWWFPRAWVWSRGGEKQCGVINNGCSLPFQGDKNVLKLDSGDNDCTDCECSKNHWTANLTQYWFILDE